MTSIHELYYGPEFRAYIYGRGESDIALLCERALLDAGVDIADSPADCDVAIAPLLERKITDAELAGPRIGTLVFHPSPLPLYPGRRAIRDTYAHGSRAGGATWFWATPKFDEGDICEQSVFEIPEGAAPREYYAGTVIPEAVALLERAVADLRVGIVRRRPQRVAHEVQAA